jgi:polar amino acid transport system substrate-binding protein
LANDPRPPKKLDDVRHKVIGGYNQDVISTWLTDHHFRVDAATEDSVNPRKLMSHRIDYWASSRPRATALLKSEPPGIVPAFAFGNTDLYLACHKGTAPALVKQLNAALDQLRQLGEFARIDARYPD